MDLKPGPEVILPDSTLVNWTDELDSAELHEKD